MQIRYPVNLTVEEYIKQHAWEKAKLNHCPFHPEGGCGFAKHSAYPRKFPEYFLVARWYCPSKQRTISLLPDIFASRFPGTLDEVEHVVNIAGTYSSQEQAAEALRPNITLPSALRWLRRRLKYVREILTILSGIFSTECSPNLMSFRRQYSVEMVLTSLRVLAEENLQFLPPIVGFGPRTLNRYSISLPSNN